jgi:hypothetical protein
MIPEPETDGLVMAGLGLIRFIAPRKKAEGVIKRYKTFVKSRGECRRG